MKVIIYFVGLIAHLTYTPNGEPTRHVAALVYENAHSAELIIPAGAVLPSRKEFVRDRVDGDGRVHFKLDGVGVVRILGLSADEMQPSTSEYQTDVFGLENGTGAVTKLKQEVIDEKLMDGNAKKIARAYLELQGGVMSVTGYYSTKGKYEGGNEVCVPSQIMYTGTAAGSVIEFVSDDGHDMRVAAGATIFVANLPPANMSGHFHEFGKLLVGDPSAGAWTVSGNSCTAKPIFDPGTLGKGAGIDCTDTHFP